jgi:hypothetical protein
MKSLSAKTFQCGVTVQGLTTLSGTVYLTALTNTATWDYVVVGTTAQGQLYTRTYAQLMSDITSGIGLSGYVPTSRTLTINGVSYDLTANRSWTISTVDYTSRLQHVVKAGVAINKGQAVYVTSADGTNMIVGLASNASEATSSKTMGLLDATVSTNGFANVVTEGLLAGLDTSTAGTEGDPVWLGTGGNLIYGLANKPYAPAHLVFIGIVTRKNSNNGEIFVKVQNGFELNEIHDVDLKTNLPTAGQLLRYDSDGLWKNWSPNYLTAEIDTLATVTGRGATTNTSITVGPDLTVQADGGVNYTASRLWLNSHNNYRGAGVHMTGVGSTWFAGTPYTDFDGGYVIARTGTSNDHSSAQYSNALLTVKSSGNVGIGTNNPTYKLDVNGSIRTSGVGGLYIDASANFGDNSGAGFDILNLGSTRALRILATSNNGWGNILLNVYGGNVGIGTTVPNRALTVNGVVGVSSGTANVPQLVLSSDANGNYISSTYMGTSSYVPMMFETSGLERMRITSAGNVVINSTSTPYVDDKLYIASGNIILDNNRGYLQYTTGGARATLLALNSSNTLTVGQSNANNASLLLYGGTGNVTVNAGTIEVARFTTAGNVGIGTTSPTEILHLSRIATDNYIKVEAGGQAANYSGLMLTEYGINWGWSLRHSAGTDALYISYQDNTPTFTDAVTFTRNGYVGIGTTGPAATLHVKGAAGATATFEGDSSQTTLLLKQGANLNYIVGLSNNISFRPNGTEALYLRGSDSNVGIGTTTPGYKLDVATGNDNAIRILNSTGSNNNGLALSVGSGTPWLDFYGGRFDIKYNTSPGSWNSGANTFLSILSSGNVGIGTTSPSTLLDVSGVITATGGNSTNWNTAYGWGNHSSAGYVPQARTLTINGTSYDLSANRSWTIATTTPGGSDTQFQYNSSGSLAGASALTYNSTTNRVGINQASPGYDLDVNGQVRVQDKLRVGTGNGVVHMSSTATINASATTVVWAQTVSVGMCAFIEYYILNNNSLTDQRAGTIMVTWNQSGTPTIAHTETTTPDIGSTTAINFTSSLVGSDARINAVNSSSAPYTIVMSYKYF